MRKDKEWIEPLMSSHIEDDIGLDGETKDCIAGDIFYRLGKYFDWRKTTTNWYEWDVKNIDIKVTIKKTKEV